MMIFFNVFGIFILFYIIGVFAFPFFVTKWPKGFDSFWDKALICILWPGKLLDDVFNKKP